MARSRLIVGVDSGPVHLSGTMDLPSVALLGRTTDAVFAMYPSVTCVSAVRSEVPCAGCWSGWGYDKSICEVECKALKSITPERVCEIIEDKLK